MVSFLAFSVKYRLKRMKKSSISALKIFLASGSWTLLAILLSSFRMALAATLGRVGGMMGEWVVGWDVIRWISSGVGGERSCSFVCQ